ncbi:UDP-N-acetylglucosamine 1-carboxyvinyltransferase [Azospirillum sp. ST 5-10]|uniref:UDP-N-acetylglucosamine 1-carboxyvinyltransferase n=1 Tax=unclassified Azospirillum TaxID=2630922 RepID=UPI003F49F823
MSILFVDGGRSLSGDIIPSANKNAILPILCASLLSRREIVIRNVPDITDVNKVLAFFRSLGSTVDVDFASGRLRLLHDGPDAVAQVRLPDGMRSSIMLVPALLKRYGRVVIEDDVKGCTLGSREIDPHIAVFRAFGATVAKTSAGILVTLDGPFRANRFWADYQSVTTTENFLLCGACASGVSEITNAASEPHVQEFCAFLERLGVETVGRGTSKVSVRGTSEVGGCTFELADDYHEVATFLALGAITGGHIRVRNSSAEHFPLLDRTFQKFGVEIRHEDGWSSSHVPDGLRVQGSFTQYVLPKVEAAPWPYIPVDLLPIFVALGLRAEGSMMYWNKVYEGAFGWVGELSKFGAHTLLCDPHRLVTFGGKPLAPATVESPFIIRVALALFMVAASIPGRSQIHNATPIRRAHPRFVEKLATLGARVEWAPGD